MADSVASAILVGQAVHGYSGGHRLLAISVQLDPVDLKTMLIMSDASGLDVSLLENSYITGYPLNNTGVFALARTWTANEIDRPGSVWTHTLLIDFSDLASLVSMKSLSKTFSRPASNDYSEYEKSVLIENSRQDVEYFSSNKRVEHKLRQIIWSLYYTPKKSVIATADEGSEKIVLNIWKQQWPRLRRNFRFCTLSLSDRSAEGTPFDLQFVPHVEKGLRARFPKAAVAENSKILEEDWLELAVADIYSSQITEFQEFLRSSGSDAGSGRETFIPLCQYYLLLKQIPSSITATEEAISKLRSEQAMSNVILSMIVNGAMKYVSEVNLQSFEFVLEHLSLVSNDTLNLNAHSLAARIWSEHLGAVPELLEKPGSLRNVLQEFIKKLELEPLCEALKQSTSMENTILAYRPDITAARCFWETVGDNANTAMRVAQTTQTSAQAIQFMIEARRTDLASLAVTIFGATDILQCIYLAVVNGKDFLIDQWFDRCLEDRPALAKSLIDYGCKESRMAMRLAHSVDPDFVPSIDNVDPWLIASQSIRGDLSHMDSLFLSGYLLARSFGKTSTQKGQLLEENFDDIYLAAEKNRLPSYIWERITPYLPRVPWFSDWDRCERLRMGIVYALTGGSIEPKNLATITTHRTIFKALVKSISKADQGYHVLFQAYANLDQQQQQVVSKFL